VHGSGYGTRKERLHVQVRGFFGIGHDYWITPCEMILTSMGTSLCETKNRLRLLGSTICRRKKRAPELAMTATGVSGVPTFALIRCSRSRMAGGASVTWLFCSPCCTVDSTDCSSC